MGFKQESSLEMRQIESSRVKDKYPGRICVIVERSKSCPCHIPKLDKRKFLVTNDMTLSQFIYVIRKRMKIAPEESILCFVNDSELPKQSEIMSVIYDTYKDEDGFLYLTYTGENTFG